jgi:hypothetical protein
LKTQLTDNAPATRNLAAAGHASTHGSPVAQAESAATSTPLAHAAHPTWDHRVNHSPRQLAQRRILGAAFGPAVQRAPQGLNVSTGSGVLQLENLPADSTGSATKLGETQKQITRELTRIDLQKKLMLAMGNQGQKGFGYRLTNYWMSEPGVLEDADPFAVENHGMLDGSAFVEDSDINQQLSEVVLSTLDAAGQLSYLQDNWKAIKPTHHVLIDVDWYRERTQSDVGFHKDSRGTTLFVNLTYENANEIQSAEIQPDLEGQPELEKRLPDEVKKDLGARRDEEKLTHDPVVPIPAERLGAYGRLSFSDPSVWHSTPRLGHRIKETDPVPKTRGELEKALKLIGIKQTFIAKSLQEVDEDSKTLEECWDEYKDLGDKYNDFGISSELDPVNKPALESATKTRPRALSINLDKDDQLKQNIQTEATQPRTFIRTWVRLIKKDG